MSPDSRDSPNSAAAASTPSPWPGISFSAFFLLLGLLSWPGLLERWVSLQWQMGNLRPLAYSMMILLLAVAAIVLRYRRRVDSLLARAFPTPRRLGFAFAAILFSLALSLIAAEVAFRVLDYPLRTTWVPSENALAQFDPELGWVYRPNFSSTQVFGNPPRSIAMHFNGIGARVPEPGYRHDPAFPTVLFLGCSYTMGHGVSYQETFANRFETLEEGLFQSVNLGVQAYGTDQALLLLKRHFEEFNTKAVIYTFLLDHVKRNDNHDRRLLFPRARFLGTKPRFTLDSEGNLRLSRTPQRFEEMARCRICELVQLFWTKSGPPPSMELTRALVHEMKEFVESRGAVFVLVLWTNAHQIPTADLLGSLFPEMEEEKVIDVGYGAPPGWDGWRIPGGFHPDARAHAYVGKLLAERFSGLGLN